MSSIGVDGWVPRSLGQEGVLRQLGLLWPSLLQMKHLEISVSVLILISLPLILKGGLRDEIVQGRTDEEGDTEIVVARHTSGARERGRKAFDAEGATNFRWEGATFSEFVD